MQSPSLESLFNKSLQPVQFFPQTQGKRRFVIIDDPRLPFVRPLLEHMGIRYDDELNRAYFLRKDHGERGQFEQVCASLQALPKLELDPNAVPYAADALRGVPGVALSRQPVDLRRRDGAWRMAAVAIDDDARVRANEAISKAVRLGPTDRFEIDQALFKLSDAQRDRFLGELRENFGIVYPKGLFEISKLDIQPYRALIEQPSKRQQDRIVEHVENGHLTSVNVTDEPWHRAIAEYQKTGSLNAVRDQVRNAVVADVESLIEKTYRLASPAQRARVQRILEQTGDTFGVEDVMEPLDLVEKWKAERYLRHAADEYDRSISDDETLENERQGSWKNEFEARYYTRDSGASGDVVSDQRRMTKGDKWRNFNRQIVEATEERLRAEGGKRVDVDEGERGAVRAGLIGAIRVEQATPSYLIGWIGEHEYVVLKPGKFRYSPEIKRLIDEAEFVPGADMPSSIGDMIVNVVHTAGAKAPTLVPSRQSTLGAAACEALAVGNAKLLRREIKSYDVPDVPARGIYVGGRGTYAAILEGTNLAIVPAATVDHADPERADKPLGILEPVIFTPAGRAQARNVKNSPAQAPKRPAIARH
jgi:hypothetical protein